MFPNLFHHYWTWAGSNIGAEPVCGLLAVLFVVGFRKPIAAYWHKHFGAKADLREIREIAEKAHRVASDTFRHVCGEAHPDAAPPKDGGTPE